MRLIDADVLKSFYEKWLSELSGNNLENADERSAVFSCLCQLDDTATIDPETLPIVQELRGQLAEVTAERDELKKNVRPVVRGEWVKRVNPLGAGDVLTRCNRCGRTSEVATPFCPWCGADMRGETK